MSKVVKKVAEKVEKGAVVVKEVSEKVAGAAGKVEIVASKVRQGNDKHRATRGRKPKDVITRKRDSNLSDIPATLYVDPFSITKTLFAQRVNFTPAGLNPGSLTSSRFDNFIFPSYQLAVIQQVKYDTSAIFTSAQTRSYLNKTSDALWKYYCVSNLVCYMREADSVNQAISAYNLNIALAETRTALRQTQFMLSQLSFPPKLHSFIKWMAGIYSLGRTPNSSDAMLLHPDFASVNDDATTGQLLLDSVNNLTVADRRISGIFGKLTTKWRLALPDYMTLPANSSLDFNWMNMWANLPIEVGARRNRDIEVEYVLFNDNPNVIALPLACVWDGTTWAPDLMSPINTGNPLMVLLSPTGTWGFLPDTHFSNLQALRNAAYYDGVGYPGSRAFPEAKTVSANAADITRDLTTVLFDWFDVETMAKQGFEPVGRPTL